MLIKVELKKPLRYFHKDGHALVETKRSVSAGSIVRICRPEIRSLDGVDIRARPFILEGNKKILYFLEHELPALPEYEDNRAA